VPAPEPKPEQDPVSVVRDYIDPSIKAM